MMISVMAEVDPWDVIEDLEEDEIANYLRDCGWQVSKTPSVVEDLTREDLDYLIANLNDINWESRRVVDKIRKLRYG